MSANSETRRLIDLTLAQLRREAADASDLHRAAWAEDDAPLPAARLGHMAGGLPLSVMLDVSALDPACRLDPPHARILLNLLILAGASLPAGGTIRLAGSADDLFMRIEGPGAAWPAGMGACLVDELAARQALLAAGNRLMPLTALLAHAAGIRLSFLLAPRRAAEPAMLRLGG